jgi:hypothetical protein
LVSAGACAIACSSDDDATTNPSGGAGGRSSAGASGSPTAGRGGGGAGGALGGSGGSLIEAGSGGEGGAVEQSLYVRLGERAGIREKFVAIVNEELTDPVIATYFSQQANSSHKPTQTDIIECFTNLLASSVDGPEEYPFTTPSGYLCRDMKAAHATLGIGAGTFDKFVAIAAATLSDLGVSADDVATIGDVLNGTKSKVVDPNVPSGVRPCSSPASCALPVIGDGGAGGEGGVGGAGGAGGATEEGGMAGTTAP